MVKRTDRSKLRILGALAAALVVSATAFPLLHFATVRHARCEAHGELLHTEDLAGASPAVTESGGEGRATARPEGPPVAHEHDACQLWASGRDEAETACSGQPTFTTHPRAADPASFAGWRRPGNGLYRLAPKGSPPA